ncbi:hypothetical protein T08_12216 [Trichinella sp. T8]|nr:hypothetical protein T08_12216 [Trichinella sp. T8]
MEFPNRPSKDICSNFNLTPKDIVVGLLNPTVVLVNLCLIPLSHRQCSRVKRNWRFSGAR